MNSPRTPSPSGMVQPQHPDNHGSNGVGGGSGGSEETWGASWNVQDLESLGWNSSRAGSRYAGRGETATGLPP
jgi:hypothetical protein